MVVRPFIPLLLRELLLLQHHLVKLLNMLWLLVVVVEAGPPVEVEVPVDIKHPPRL
jgi:hypothetical protein